MNKKKLTLRVDLEEVTWVCEDCNNTYDLGVQNCPNERLDLWLIEANAREKFKDKFKDKK